MRDCSRRAVNSFPSRSRVLVAHSPTPHSHTAAPSTATERRRSAAGDSWCSKITLPCSRSARPPARRIHRSRVTTGGIACRKERCHAAISIYVPKPFEFRRAYRTRRCDQLPGVILPEAGRIRPPRRESEIGFVREASSCRRGHISPSRTSTGRMDSRRRFLRYTRSILFPCFRPLSHKSDQAHRRARQTHKSVHSWREGDDSRRRTRRWQQALSARRLPR